MGDRFFETRTCGRCGQDLECARTMSWFTTQTICMACSVEETEIKAALMAAGEDPRQYEGCGHVPKVQAA